MADAPAAAAALSPSLSPWDWASASQLIGRRITLSLGDGSTRGGWLHAVDPESISAVLVTPPPQGTASVVFGASIAGCAVVSGAEPWYGASLGDLLPALPKGEWSWDGAPGAGGDHAGRDGDGAPADAAAVEARRAALCVVLQKARLPYTQTADGGIAVLGGAAWCGPPFAPENCEGENEMMLVRLRELVLSAAASLQRAHVRCR